MTKNFVMAAAKLAERLTEAQKAHHDVETYLPEHNWVDWYAAFITARLRCEDPVRATEIANGVILGETIVVG